MKVMTILGVRPQFVKHKIMSDALRRRGHSDIILHTGQHYDDNMHAMAIPPADYHLNMNNVDVDHAVRTVSHYVWVDNPDFVLVYGDAKATYLGALGAIKTGKPLVHVEAGLRSYDQRMKEELYRRVTDHVSDYLFAPTESAAMNLVQEEVSGRIYTSGDIMREACMLYKDHHACLDNNFMLVTLHRAELVDDELELTQAVQRIEQNARDWAVGVVWPLHPRTRKMLRRFEIDLPEEWKIVPPMTYLKMLGYIKKATLVITDSGGVQREAHWLGTPCKVFREITEWTEMDNGEVESPSEYIIDILEGEI